MTRAWRPQHLSWNTLNSAFSGCLSHCHTSIHVSLAYFIAEVYNFFNLLPGTPVVYQGSPPSLSVTGAVTQIPTDVTIVTPATGDELAMRDLFIPLLSCTFTELLMFDMQFPENHSGALGILILSFPSFTRFGFYTYPAADCGNMVE